VAKKIDYTKEGLPEPDPDLSDYYGGGGKYGNLIMLVLAIIVIVALLLGYCLE
jgi:hypothetical protein